jgi:energy-coupling factor transport system permease protein
VSTTPAAGLGGGDGRQVSLDPRTRLVLLLLAVAALAFTRSLWLLAAVVAILCVAALAAGLEATLRAAGRLTIVMAVLIFVLTAYGAGLDAGLAAVLRLLAIVASAVLALGTTSPTELGDALVAGGLPYPAAFVIMAAVQFVPVIGRRAAAVRDAQRARGIPLDTGVAGIRHATALALPVLYQSFKLAEELAEALESRGFSRRGRTYRRAYRLQMPDWLVLGGAAVATAIYVRLGGL